MINCFLPILTLKRTTLLAVILAVLLPVTECISAYGTTEATSPTVPLEAYEHINDAPAEEIPLPSVTLSPEQLDSSPLNQPAIKPILGVQTISLSGCMATVLAHSTNVALARVEVALQETILQQQKPRLRPKLSLIINNQQSIPLPVPETTNPTLSTTSFSTSGRLHSQITVWDFGQSAYLYEKTKRSLIKTKLTEAETQRLVKETVLQAYATALKAQYQWQYATETLTNLTEKQAALQLLFNTQSPVTVEGETLAQQLQHTTEALIQQQNNTQQAQTQVWVFCL
jgi:outer membrane protein TolC